MLLTKYEDANDKLRNLLDKANGAADAASKGLTDNLLNKISDAELEKLRIAAKKAEEELDYSKDIKEKLWLLVRQHDESEIQTDTKHARTALLQQLFSEWLAEFKEDKKLLERLMVGFALYGDALGSYNHIGWQRFLVECFGVEHDNQMAVTAKAALIARHAFLRD